jgi:undecaprenyl-diphosphatase
MFVVFTIGMFSGTIVPLPGGLVGMEAGLLVGLLAYNVPTAQAGAVVVIFRLVTYWLPILPGIAALFLARRRRLI